MTYLAGNLLVTTSGTASQFQTDVNGADQALGTNTLSDYDSFLAVVNNVYGVGDGDYGYGQTAIVQAAIGSGAPVLASQWLNLRNMIATCGQQQGIDLTYLPAASQYAAGKLIVAFPQDAQAGFKADSNDPDQTLGSNAGLNGITVLPNYVWAIDANRMRVASDALTVTTGVSTVTRGTSWTNSVTCEVYALWASEDEARYFFNSGGQLRINPSHPNSPPGSAQNADCSIMLSNVGQVRFTAYGTTSTGTQGALPIGYYSLTDTYKIIYSDVSPDRNDNIVIEAKRVNYVGTHSGNGRGVQFSIALGDSTGLTMTAGTAVSFDHAKATTYLSGISSPTYTTVTPL